MAEHLQEGVDIDQRVDCICNQCHIDMDTGFDLYIATDLDGSGMESPEMVRVRITRDFLLFVEKVTALLVMNELSAVESVRYPGTTLVASDAPNLTEWTLVLDDEGFRFQVDNQPSIRSVTVFREALYEAMNQNSGPFEWSVIWHAGAMILATLDPRELVPKAEKAFPLLAAEAAREAMAATIAASLPTAPAASASHARRRPAI